MTRTAVNPVDWSLDFGFNQAQLVEGPARILDCSGQTSVNENGEPQHAGDMAAQLRLVLDNLDALLAAAQMSFADVTRLMIFTTDVGRLLEHHDLIEERLSSDMLPASTLLGVSALASPELLVEIQATAMQ